MKKTLLLLMVLLTMCNAYSFNNTAYINILNSYQGGLSIGYQHEISTRNAIGLYLDFQATKYEHYIYGAYFDYSFYAKGNFQGFWPSVKIGYESYFNHVQFSLVPAVGYNWIMPFGFSLGFNLGFGPSIRVRESEWNLRFLGNGHIGYCF